jgi:hypothetical protein
VLRKSGRLDRLADSIVVYVILNLYIILLRISRNIKPLIINFP